MEWLSEQLDEQNKQKSIIESNIQLLAREYALQHISRYIDCIFVLHIHTYIQTNIHAIQWIHKSSSIVDGHPDVLMDSVMGLTQRMSVAQRTELSNVLASLDDVNRL